MYLYNRAKCTSCPRILCDRVILISKLIYRLFRSSILFGCGVSIPKLVNLLLGSQTCPSVPFPFLNSQITCLEPQSVFRSHGQASLDPCHILMWHADICDPMLTPFVGNIKVGTRVWPGQRSTRARLVAALSPLMRD